MTRIAVRDSRRRYAVPRIWEWGEKEVFRDSTDGEETVSTRNATR